MDDVPQLSEHMRLLKVEDALKLATQFFEERILKLGLFLVTLVCHGFPGTSRKTAHFWTPDLLKIESKSSLR